MRFEVKIAVMAAATILAFLEIILLFHCRKRRPIRIKQDVFLLEGLYPSGSFIREKLHISKKTNRNRQQKMLELWGPAEAAQISANASAAPYAYTMVFFPVLLMIFALSGSAVLFFMELLLLVLLCCYFDLWLNREIKRRHEELLSDYPSMLTELSLMIHVGIPAHAAFERVAGSSDGLLYREMKRTVSNMANGMTVKAAFDGFLTRCPLRELRKFASLYQQNLVKGGADFPALLGEMASDAWEKRKNSAVTKGELAEQKLLLPTMLMFIGILLIVIVPAFQNML